MNSAEFMQQVRCYLSLGASGPFRTRPTRLSRRLAAVLVSFCLTRFGADNSLTEALL